MITLPPGSNPTVPVEPAEIPCSNPPECEQYDEQVARTMKWDQWEYICFANSPNNATGELHVVGYETKWYRAWMGNPNNTLAHPPPEIELAQGNVISVIRRPPPIS